LVVGASISHRCDSPPILPRFSLNETPKNAYFGAKSGTTCSLSDCHPHLFESPILQKLHYKVLNIDYLMSESDTYFFFTETLLRRLCYLFEWICNPLGVSRGFKIPIFIAVGFQIRLNGTSLCQ